VCVDEVQFGAVGTLRVDAAQENGREKRAVMAAGLLLV